jgi:hypothetical protein
MYTIASDFIGPQMLVVDMLETYNINYVAVLDNFDLSYTMFNNPTPGTQFPSAFLILVRKPGH